jgi:hypothetical protein
VDHAETSPTGFIHSPRLPRRKTAAVALLQQASCNKASCGEGMKDVNVFSAWPTSMHIDVGPAIAERLDQLSQVAAFGHSIIEQTRRPEGRRVLMV